ncbi:hypothetical protein A3D42_01880 [Candidatus Nomurabacteria bacterium RIFCSPHIGHO2_02_FULL_41_18]|uniref:Membrane insertase YidC/Oxa/ALB C-terminal domain-containing protein n=1 Tax=Candidatus Nomurabacteria bacterium RIFCSPHIGHO2_02_FULL_41_18 TaxID=1801754 RepID=A0A1F6W8A7_9BACT|nr:MAG: hypothetical protein A2737_01825 [Candidatus Nomurabacteria bacterium RIFCSPHIGHO2_01_FULL_41_71]OGI78006.1 MAG: hypothetical protein A3D42_01880 [Candidatus Nomurabacteria bacterium RIFCSPHIGHO2_02_FULL_41_18]OGI90285.1 MAG: hypothetical protein A3B01_03205 [Candidatus Nomurabacteria bacterium RIFCSPLOWO2_01_FULL_41_52b]OGJ00016.1 MAG: hypothetical protein A3I90_02355 [Candidatus Nomurabacteria bacterium RIFCSPLOWO2_02_FULL_41_9]
MLHNIWDFTLYKPLINALAFLVSIIPGGDLGIAVILITILIKLILFPLSQHSIRNQAAMAMLGPEINKIKANGKSKEEQARLTFELYKKHKTNPFSGCLVQIPIIIIFISLYYVFYKGVNFNTESLYSFVHIPENINLLFLGILDISQKNIILAILAGASQYFQAYFMPKLPSSQATPGSFQESFSKSMNMQMKYFFPFLMAFIAYGSGALALYWITSNVFTIFQQIYVGKTEARVLHKEAEKLNP